MAVNRFNQTHVSQYNPLSMDEVLAPAMIQRQREDKILEQYADTQSALGEVGAVLSSEPDDSVLKQNYNNYSQQLSSAWDNIAEHGVTANSMRKAMNLRSQLSSVISPVMNAHKARSADMGLSAEILSKDPTAVLEDVSQRSLDFYVQNGFTPTGVKSVSGNAITQEVSAMASVLSKLQNKPELTQADIGSLQTFGLSREEAQNMLMLVKSTSGLSFDNLEDNPVIQEIIGNVMKRNGVLDTENKLAPWMDTQGYEKLYQSALSGTYSAVGPTSYNIRDNPFAVMEAERQAAIARARLSVNTDNPNDTYKGTSNLGSDEVPNFDVMRKRTLDEPGMMASDLTMMKANDLLTRIQTEDSSNLIGDYENPENHLNITNDMLDVLDNLVGDTKNASGLRNKLLAHKQGINVRIEMGSTLGSKQYNPQNTSSLIKEFSEITKGINNDADPVIGKIDNVSSQLNMDRREYYTTVDEYSKLAGGPKMAYSFPKIPEEVSKKLYDGVTRVTEINNEDWVPKGKEESINLKELRNDGNVTLLNTPRGHLLRVQDKNGHFKYYQPERPAKEGVYVQQSSDIILNPAINNENGILPESTADKFISILDLNNGDYDKTARQMLRQYVSSEGGGRYLVNQSGDIFGDLESQRIVELSFPVRGQNNEKGYMVIRGTLANGQITNTGFFNTLDKSPDSFSNMVKYSQDFLYNNTSGFILNTDPSQTN